LKLLNEFAKGKINQFEKGADTGPKGTLSKDTDRDLKAALAEYSDM